MSDPPNDGMTMPSHNETTNAAGNRDTPSIREVNGFRVEVQGAAFDQLFLMLEGSISVTNADRVFQRLSELVEAEPLKNVVLDLQKVTYFDSAAAAIIVNLRNKCESMRNSLILENTTTEVSRLLDLLHFESCAESCRLQPRPTPGVVTQVGEATIEFVKRGREVIAFIGEVFIALAKDFSQPRRIQWDQPWKLLERAGSDAVPIVSLLGFLMGAILAFQAAIQLRKFGANIFVADLVSVAISLEMGPLMSSIIVSGRSGAAYAAHIGTMQVTEEIDALRVMAVDPIRYLVSPRIVAVAVTLPCLTVFADIVGIIGGCVVAWASLDITPVTYFNQVLKILEVSDVVKGLIKSFVFGIEIALIGCFFGFQVRGGAEGVGTATTRAVVACIFVLTITDAIFAMLFHYTNFI